MPERPTRERSTSRTLESQVHALEQTHPNSFLSLAWGVYAWGGFSALREFIAVRPRVNYERFVERGYMFHHSSSFVSLWNWFMVRDHCSRHRPPSASLPGALRVPVD